MRRFIKFRAYADEKKSYWVDVRMFETPQEMRRDIRKALGYVDPRVAGQVNAFQRIRKGRKLGVFAVMWMNRKDSLKFPMEYVAHESTHCAIRYFERRGWPVCLAYETSHGAPDVHEHRYEERLAYAVGRIASCINRRLFRHGIWK